LIPAPPVLPHSHGGSPTNRSGQHAARYWLMSASWPAVEGVCGSGRSPTGARPGAHRGEAMRIGVTCVSHDASAKPHGGAEGVWYESLPMTKSSAPKRHVERVACAGPRMKFRSDYDAFLVAGFLHRPTCERWTKMDTPLREPAGAVLSREWYNDFVLRCGVGDMLGAQVADARSRHAGPPWWQASSCAQPEPPQALPPAAGGFGSRHARGEALEDPQPPGLVSDTEVDPPWWTP